MTSQLWLYPFVAFVLTLLFTPLAILYSKKMHLLDYPGDRRSHRYVIPRGGGAVAVVVLLVFGLILYFHQYQATDMAARSSIFAFVFSAFLMGVTGFMDDHAVLSNRVKLLLQVLACGASLFILSAVTPSAALTSSVLLLATLFAMIWLTNLYNFMDGSHGLAAGQGVFSGLLFAWIFAANGTESLYLLALLLVGICAGFLWWNFPQPKAFMGDVLSGVLGVCFSVLIVAGWLVYQLDLVLLCLVLAAFIVDATLTLLARILTGQKWYNPHRQHAYQYLVANGLGHTKTWMAYQGLNMLIVLPSVWLVKSGRINSILAATVVYLLFGLLWYAIYFKQRNNNKNTKLG